MKVQPVCDAFSINPSDMLMYRCKVKLEGSRTLWQKFFFNCPMLCYEKSRLAAKLDTIQR